MPCYAIILPGGSKKTTLLSFRTWKSVNLGQDYVAIAGKPLEFMLENNFYKRRFSMLPPDIIFNLNYCFYPIFYLNKSFTEIISEGKSCGCLFKCQQLVLLVSSLVAAGTLIFFSGLYKGG